MTPTFSCCRQAIKAQPANTLRIDLPTGTSSSKAKKVCVGGMTIPTLVQHALASAEPMPYKEIMARDPAFIRYLRSLPAEAVGYAFGNVLELYQFVKGKDSEVTLVRRDIHVACFAYVFKHRHGGTRGLCSCLLFTTMPASPRWTTRSCT